MKQKLVGIAGVAILFLFATVGGARADGIRGGHDGDSDGSRFSADVSASAIHDASITEDSTMNRDSGDAPHFDHDRAWSPESLFHNHNDDDAAPGVPEPSSLLLLAGGLAPLLWMRRKSGV
jgi:hypothetical protein